MKFTKRVNRLKSTSNDKIYTPIQVALKMIEMCEITPEMKVLDCCKGGGVFYDNLPPCKKEYCEIDENIDFFENKNKYDLIIGNPPYSLWDEWVDHTMEMTDKFCYIFGTFNLTEKRMGHILRNNFGITKFHLTKIDWWFSPSFVAVFERNKPSIMSVEYNRILCECGKRCKRGQKGADPNVCAKKLK